MRQDNKTKYLSLDSLVTQFLYNYRNTPHTGTGRTPAEMIFKFKPNTLIDNLRPYNNGSIKSTGDPMLN